MIGPKPIKAGRVPPRLFWWLLLPVAVVAAVLPVITPGASADPRRSYQAGLSDGVARLIGHRPGSCDICRARPVTATCRQLLALLGLAEGGAAGVPGRVAGLVFTRMFRTRG